MVAPWFLCLLFLRHFGRITAHVQEDVVHEIPGFGPTPFVVYSGFLNVPGPINGYDSLSIHYQFHASMQNPKTDPLVVWHQGGPGGSAISGLYMEMGYFQLSDSGPFVNQFSWNHVANMLYMETPAGAGFESGYSACIMDSVAVNCSWDDLTQAEAYAHTLRAFFTAFPEYAETDMYLAGESYYGNYGPNIAHYILNHKPFNTSFKFRGLMMGNCCWNVTCCGPNFGKQYDVDFYFGKGLYSQETHSAIDQVCTFPYISDHCQQLLDLMDSEIGPHNPSNIYDNCPNTQALLEKTGNGMSWLLEKVRRGPNTSRGAHSDLAELNGGFDWACGGFTSFQKWILRPDVRSALHLDQVEPHRSNFNYKVDSGPFAIDLYPDLARRIRILIYNGDADPSVPYNGIEYWINDYVNKNFLEKVGSWKPWHLNSSKSSPVAGSITKYKARGSLYKDADFVFALVRLAGHTVPQFQPQASLTLIKNFISDGRRDTGQISNFI